MKDKEKIKELELTIQGLQTQVDLCGEQIEELEKENKRLKKEMEMVVNNSGERLKSNIQKDSQLKEMAEALEGAKGLFLEIRKKHLYGSKLNDQIKNIEKALTNYKTKKG